MKKVFRTSILLRMTLGASVLSLSLGGIVAAVNLVPHGKASTAHGGNIEFKSMVDQSFCIDVAPGALPDRSLFMLACSPSSTQRWTVTKNSDGSNLFIDSQGLCVDTVGRKAGDGVAVKVVNCTFVKSQRFSFNSIGQFRIYGTQTCLSIPRASSDVAVFLETCNSSSVRQQFRVSI